jgi:superfamily II DNA/RNA helicase
LRHVVLRKRKDLEDAGLLNRIGVVTHPLPHQAHRYQSRFMGLGLPTHTPFEVAYEQAERFCKLLYQRTQSGGFMKTLMLQRLCSSFASGLKTAERMLQRSFSSDEEERQADAEHLLAHMSAAEIACLQTIQAQLSRPEAIDSKLATVKWFLTEFHSDGMTWLEHGCIIFSQYFDTAQWIAQELAKGLPNETIAVYAGVGKSGLYRGSQFSSVERESIKSAVKQREIRLVVATDAACEGLNLQTLGTLINIDLPWNPSRLEQRLGRIKRFGQARSHVDMLNLVYADTQDEKIYTVLSERLKDAYDLFGSLPDTIEDDWIEDETQLAAHIDVYMHERERAQNAFSVKYQATLDPSSEQWEQCAEVLARRDVLDNMSRPW